ncbi:MAG: hypothetical protein PHH54_04175 [Candidatus Nanoarchaeia archaeon]|nr:hypothetical protein [Candidatus Nanoarchaeia archaeon]MDD5741157.1 hypothetical protein [Candidatus Nanoarchaeia archaeon]
MKNKKADERVLSIYLFLIYIIVCIGIVSGVVLFFGSGLDVRVAEAGVLSDKVIGCLTEQGKLNENVLKDDFDLLKSCNFNFKDNSEAYKEDEQYGVRVELYNFDSCIKEGEPKVINCSNEVKRIESGREDYLEFCGLSGDKIPKCDIKEAYLLSNRTRVFMRVTSSVGKVNKNI